MWEKKKLRKTKSDNLPLIEQVIDLNVWIVLYIFLLRFVYLEYIFFVLLKDVYSKNERKRNFLREEKFRIVLLHRRDVDP